MFLWENNKENKTSDSFSFQLSLKNEQMIGLDFRRFLFDVKGSVFILL